MRLPYVKKLLTDKLRFLEAEINTWKKMLSSPNQLVVDQAKELIAKQEAIIPELEQAIALILVHDHKESLKEKGAIN